MGRAGVDGVTGCIIRRPNLAVVGVQVGQTEPGSVVVVLGDKYLLKFRARYVLLTRAWILASMELSPGGIGEILEGRPFEVEDVAGVAGPLLL